MKKKKKENQKKIMKTENKMKKSVVKNELS